jgi:hypothetical protein
MMIASLLTAAALLAAPPMADETVTSGQVSAHLHGDALTITRAGAVAYDQPIPDVVCDGCVLQGTDDIELRDLDGDGEPEAIVTASTGGMHCCELTGIYGFDGTGYDQLVSNWESAGYNFKDLNHDARPEIVSLDVRFEDRFTAHVVSFPPPAVFHYDHGKLVDITRSFPTLIKANAREASNSFNRFTRSEPDGAGVVSAYVADQYLLGHGSTGLRELDKQIARGAVKKSFRKKLLSVLHKYGYR